MRGRNIDYLAGVDHVRAFASLLIVLYHTQKFVFAKLTHGGPPRPLDTLPSGGPFGVFVAEGHTAVSLFIVLSGFIFTWGTLGRQVGYAGFLRNRLLRIYPLFLFLVWVGMAVHPGTVRLDSLALTLLGLANLPASLQLGSVSAMFWTVAIEWQFYLVFPFLLSFANQRGARPLLLLVAVAVLFRTLALALGGNVSTVTYYSILGRIDQFALGMLAAMALRSGRVPVAAWRLALLPALAAMAGLLLAFHGAGGLRADAPWRAVWPTVEGLGWAVVVLGWLALAEKLPARVSAGLAAVGAVSYSTYLIHFPLVDLAVGQGWVVGAGGPLPAAALLTSLLVVVPAVLALATLTYHAVEKPFLDLRRVYVRGSRDVPGPTGR